jgi:glycosyltransferase involved in cell wall biosynthesis
MSTWPVSNIPTPIDTSVWKPANKNLSRETLGLPIDVPIILFGASHTDLRKGFDLFIESLDLVIKLVPKAKFAVFGTSDTGEKEVGDHRITFLGDLRDDLSLRLAYSAADVFVIPSRQDNLPNTGIESQACGTPVVAFNIGGLNDVVLHLSTGYLAKPFDLTDFASGIRWAYLESLNPETGQRCLHHVNAVFSEEKVAGQYRQLYSDILSI